MIENEEKQTGQRQKKVFFNSLLEIYIWIFLAVIVFFPALYYSMTRRIYDDFILEFYNQFLLGILLILTPILFKLIFGKLPLEFLRTKREEIKETKFQKNNDPQVFFPETSDDEKIESYNIICINESKAIAERVFSRSGVYLLVGCLVAFIGVAIFYSPIFQTTNSTDITQRLLDYLPRFGALFFIEFIAFFFLKQYRIMLEEYRYYEVIKRKRQDNLNLIELIETNKDNLELLKLITENISQTVITKLSNGETTEILETQKIINQDLDIFSKFTELIKELKGK